jgi:hypothetical protein
LDVGVLEILYFQIRDAQPAIDFLGNQIFIISKLIMLIPLDYFPLKTEWHWLEK